MDKNTDYNFYGMPPFNNPNMNMYDDYSANMDSNAMFNPLMQYEQAYMYYRYLSMQMEYKIKCKEYERLNSKNENTRDSSRKIE